MPLLEHLGVTVVDERPYEIDAPRRHRPVDLLVRCAGRGGRPARRSRGAGPRGRRLPRGVGGHDRERRAEPAGAPGRPLRRDVVIVRALCQYLHQAGVRFTDAYLADTLAANPERGAPDRRAVPPAPRPRAAARSRRRGRRRRRARARDRRGGQPRRRPDPAGARARRGGGGADERVPGPSRTWRASSTRRRSTSCPGRGRSTRSGWRPPRWRASTSAPATSPRGGIRWSDRREDFRTEILGLMKAQSVKNAVIVPVGAKGGFVVKRPPPASDRVAVAAAVLDGYRTFIRGLLELTDNLVDGRVVPPEGVVRHDGDDPYLVVAADKGTGSFSDVANELAARVRLLAGRRVRLRRVGGIRPQGDGHHVARRVDLGARPLPRPGRRRRHRAARGRGHRRHVGRRVRQRPPAVAAPAARRRVRPPSRVRRPRPRSRPPASPSGNGCSSSRHRRGPTTTRRCCPPGAGCTSAAPSRSTSRPRHARVLGVDDRPLTPDELVRAVLRAPVDLLWNGGIGTFVKASTESDADVGDRTNDPVRIDATELRCRVVAEGGNLGLHPTRRGSSTPSPAAASTPTPSTTRPASTAPTTR